MAKYEKLGLSAEYEQQEQDTRLIGQRRKELAELTKALEAMQTAKDPRPEQGKTKQSRRSKYNAKRKPSKSDGMIPLSGNFVEMKNPVVSAS